MSVLQLTLRLRTAVESSDRFDDRLGDLLGATYELAGGVASVTGYIETGSSSAERIMRATEFADRVRQLGGDPESCDPDLVDIGEIAARVDRDDETVRLWARGKRRTAVPFPSPLFTLAGGQQIWAWDAVNTWLRESGSGCADEVEFLNRTERKVVDAYLVAEDRRAAALMISAITRSIRPASVSGHIVGARVVTPYSVLRLAEPPQPGHLGRVYVDSLHRTRDELVTNASWHFDVIESHGEELELR